jgi:hypothetical protein
MYIIHLPLHLHPLKQLLFSNTLNLNLNINNKIHKQGWWGY